MDSARIMKWISVRGAFYKLFTRESAADNNGLITMRVPYSKTPAAIINCTIKHNETSLTIPIIA